jgi:hypothetical protein
MTYLYSSGVIPVFDSFRQTPLYARCSRLRRECESPLFGSTREFPHSLSPGFFVGEHGLNTRRLVHLPAVSVRSDFDDRTSNMVAL